MNKKNLIRIFFILVIIVSGVIYYVESTNNKKYRMSIKVDEERIPFLKVGDEITVFHNDGENIKEITKLG